MILNYPYTTRSYPKELIIERDGSSKGLQVFFRDHPEIRKFYTLFA